MKLPQLEIRTVPALIGISNEPGRFDIRQPRPTFEMKRIDAQLTMRQPQGEMRIDSSRAFDAYGTGGNLQAMSRIYASGREAAMQGIARIVENGNRLAAIHKGGEPIADNAEANQVGLPELDVVGPASFDNVDIFYTARQPEIDVEPGRIDIHTAYNRPEIHYWPGKLSIYMQQYPSIEIIPPQVDFRL